MVDGSNESLYHADEELHPLVRTFLLSQTIFTNLDVKYVVHSEKCAQHYSPPSQLFVLKHTHFYFRKNPAWRPWVLHIMYHTTPHIPYTQILPPLATALLVPPPRFGQKK